jgi:hypothetical protein
MKKWIKQPWYIFLIPLFYMLHAYNANFGIITTAVFLRYTLYYLLLAVFVFLPGLAFFRNTSKAGCWTAIFLCIFFFFGSAYDFMATHGVPKFFISYKFLLSAITIVLIVAAYRLKKSPAPQKLNLFFGLLFTSLFTLEVISMIYNFANGKQQENNLAGSNKPLTIQLSTLNKADMPDIFFIVFDEYTSSTALKKYFSFDNSPLDSSLKDHGFFIAANSQSNYNSTPLSIASAFDMQYFNRQLEHVPNDAIMLLQGALSLKKSLLPALLQQQGYEIINYGLCDIENHPIDVTPVFQEYEIKAITLETLWGRIKRDIYWNVMVRLPGYTGTVSPNMPYINRNRNNFNNFINELGRAGDKPRFVVGHVLLPRRPAWLDRHGNIRQSFTMNDYSDESHDSLYLEQVIYANTLIDSLDRTADRQHNRPLALIIEGDHGNRYAEWGKHIREKQFMNLNTYYFSDRDYSLLYDSISPVNSFRVILNKYFDAHLPFEKDSTVWLR